MKAIQSKRDFTGYAIRSHKACGATTRVHVPGWMGNQITPAQIAALGGTLRAGAKAFGTANPTYSMTSVLVPCRGCGNPLSLDRFQSLYGRTVTEIVCGGKCMNATGPSCDCSCGGMNHGAGHGYVPTEEYTHGGT